jgi:hypothetical protein
MGDQGQRGWWGWLNEFHLIVVTLFVAIELHLFIVIQIIFYLKEIEREEFDWLTDWSKRKKNRSIDWSTW